MVKPTKNDHEQPLTGDLSPRQVNILACLLSGKSIKATAEDLKIATQTIDDNLRRPEFKAALRAGQDAIFNAAIARLTALSGKAMTALEEILDDRDSKLSDRNQAAKTVLTVLVRYRDSDIIERMCQLEASIKEIGGDR